MFRENLEDDSTKERDPINEKKKKKVISTWSEIEGLFILPITPVVKIIQTFSCPNCRNYWRNFCLKASLAKTWKKHKRWSSVNLTEDIKLMAAGPLEDWCSSNKHFMPCLEKRERTLSSSKTPQNFIFYLESKDSQEKVQIQMSAIRGKPLGDKEANR